MKLRDENAIFRIGYQQTDRMSRFGIYYKRKGQYGTQSRITN